jgi:hypothetical protein
MTPIIGQQAVVNFKGREYVGTVRDYNFVMPHIYIAVDVGAAVPQYAPHNVRLIPVEPGPVPMLLFCPRCMLQHIDAPNPGKGWTNPPHRTHECQDCGHLWRPCDLPTTGVLVLKTRSPEQAAADPIIYGRAR